MGWPVLGYLLGKNFRRRDRDHLVPPRGMDAAVCCRGVLSFRSGSETPRVHHAAWLSGGVATRRRRLVGDSWNNDHHMRRECMRCQSSFAFIPLMILPLVTIAKAHDASRYTNLHGQWTVIITPGLGGQAVKFDPTKPWGRGQQAPLTAEYQKVHEDSMADQAKGGLGNYPTATCHPGGMPRMMSVGEYEYIIEPET